MRSTLRSPSTTLSQSSNPIYRRQGPRRGIIVKTAGKVDSQSGLGPVDHHFENSPQVPFSKFTLKFNRVHLAPFKSCRLRNLYGRS